MEKRRKFHKRYCSAYGCLNSNLRMPDLSLFSLPKDAERRRKWLILINRKDLLKRGDLKFQNYAVCIHHFEKSAIKMTHQLKPDAVPTLNLPDQSEDETSHCKPNDDAVVATQKLPDQSKDATSHYEPNDDPLCTKTKVSVLSDIRIREADNPSSGMRVQGIQTSGRATNKNTRHDGVTCTYCNTEIVGNRYTCLQCLSVDLCSSCEAADFHPQHVVIKLPTPFLYEVVMPCLEPVRKALHMSMPKSPASSPSVDRKLTVSSQETQTSFTKPGKASIEIELSRGVATIAPLQRVSNEPKKRGTSPNSTATKRTKNKISGGSKKMKTSKDAKVAETSKDGNVRDYVSNWEHGEDPQEDVDTPAPGQQKIEVVYPERMATAQTEELIAEQDIKVEIKIEDDLSEDEEICIQYGSHNEDPTE